MTVWYAALFALALAGLALIWRLFHPPARLEIGERGILDRSLGWGWIPWEEIEGAYPPTEKTETVRLKLRRSARLARILGGEKRDVARTGSKSVEIQLDLSGTDFTPVELLQRILNHPESGPAARDATRPER